MKKIWFTIFTVVVLALVIVLIFIQTKNNSEVIRIGVIAPLTGNASIYGNALKKGLDLAKDEINVNGGIQEKRISLVYEDSNANPTTAVSAFKKLIDINRVSTIIGAMFSAPTLAIAPLAQKNKIVLLSPTASSDKVSDTGDFIFSIYPSDSYDGELIANFVHNSLKKDKVGIIFVQADAMIAAKDAFKMTLNELGSSVQIEEGYSPGTNDFRSILAKIRKFNPEVVFIPGYLGEIVKILIQAREMNIKSQFITISTVYDTNLFSLAKNAAEGLIFSAPFYDENSSQSEIIAFRQSYESKYGEAPNVWAAYGYDALKIISEAYSNSFSHKSLLHVELGAIKDFNGMTGKTSFLESGKAEKQLRILVVRNNRFVEYK